MRIYKVDFEPIYPVGGVLVLAAKDLEQADSMARETVKHTDVITVKEVDISKPCIIEYLNGDY